MGQFNNSFSEEIYNQSYRYLNETIEDTQSRVATDIASVEDNKEYWADKFKYLLKDFKFIPGGRILSNAGTGIAGTGLLNCHVSGFKGTSRDSMESIMDELKRQALILKSEGGYGFCADVMRPKGAFIAGIASESPGAAEMLKMWDTQSFVITKGSGKKSDNKKAKGKIRKGAQMVTMSCWHPDIESFITAKQTSGTLAHFNMSVLITDTFMDAVQNHKPWQLVFPDIEANKNLYNASWDGNLDQWIKLDGKVVVYNEYKDANELYDLIMTSTYNRNEPGVLFVDTINKLNPLYYAEHISATNPCVPAGTEILTDNGYVAIDTVIGKEVNVWNGSEFSKVTPKVTGQNQPLVKVVLSFGQELICTPSHKFVLKDGSRVEAQDLHYNDELIKVEYPIVTEVPKNPQMNFATKTLAIKQQKFLTQCGVETAIVHMKREQRYQLRYVSASEYNRVLVVDDLNKKAKEVYCFTEPNRHMGCFEGVVTSNCGEQPLPTFASCCLGSFNLAMYVNEEMTDFDYERLSNDIPLAIRFLDNVNSVTKLPLKEQEEEIQNKRRIGLGIMGYGSALMMMRVRYGSKKAIDITEKLMNTLTNEGYIASSMIANEKGSFKLFDVDKYLAGEYISKLQPRTKDFIKKYGLRNSHITTIAPTGTTGILANNVSGGLEPVFEPEYIRTSTCPVPPDGMTIPTIDWNQKTFVSDTNTWDWIKEGDVLMLSCIFDGKVYKIDSIRGLCVENRIEDFGVKKLKEANLWDSTADWAASSRQLSVDEHIAAMDVFSRHLCSSASKTINMPADYSYEDFKSTYLKMYKTGTIKGGTTYREGTMTAVLSSSTQKKKPTSSINKTIAPKRPDLLSCEIHEITSNGSKYVVLVGLLDETPYEVFAFRKDIINLSNKIKEGKLKKIKRTVDGVKVNQYDLIIEGLVTIENICQFYSDDAEDTITRLISTSLRHGADMSHIYTQLSKSKGTIVSFSKAISRALKRYTNEELTSKEGLVCPSCKSPKYRKDGGCSVCPDCGYSACS